MDFHVLDPFFVYAITSCNPHAKLFNNAIKCQNLLFLERIIAFTRKTKKIHPGNFVATKLPNCMFHRIFYDLLNGGEGRLNLCAGKGSRYAGYFAVFCDGSSRYCDIMFIIQYNGYRAVTEGPLKLPFHQFCLFFIKYSFHEEQNLLPLLSLTRRKK